MRSSKYFNFELILLAFNINSKEECDTDIVICRRKKKEKVKM